MEGDVDPSTASTIYQAQHTVERMNKYVRRTHLSQSLQASLRIPPVLIRELDWGGIQLQ